MGGARARVGFVLRSQAQDLGVLEEAVDAQELEHVRVGRVQPELVERIGRGARLIQPDGPGLRLAEFAAVRLGDERRGQAECFGLMLAANQINPADDVAPLIRPTYLQGDAVLLEEMQEIVSLQEHVAELGVTDALLAVLQAIPDRVLLDHHVDREVLADVAQHLQVADALEPIRVVQDDGCIRSAEIQQALEDRALAGHVLLDLLERHQGALRVLAGWIADHAGAASGDHDGAVACLLKASQEQDRDQVANRERIPSWVEAAIHGARTLQMSAQPIRVRLLMNQAAKREIFEQVHERGRDYIMSAPLTSSASASAVGRAPRARRRPPPPGSTAAPRSIAKA